MSFKRVGVLPRRPLGVTLLPTVVRESILMTCSGAREMAYVTWMGENGGVSGAHQIMAVHPWPMGTHLKMDQLDSESAGGAQSKLPLTLPPPTVVLALAEEEATVICTLFCTSRYASISESSSVSNLFWMFLI